MLPRPDRPSRPRKRRPAKATSRTSTLTRIVMSGDPPHWDRAAAARELGEAGMSTCVPGLRAGLRDRHRDVWVHALRGIHKALWEGRATRGFREGLFEPVAALLRRSLADSSVPACLLMMDRDRGAALLLKPKHFRAGGRHLG